MGRIARAVASGHPHHVTQRGNFRRDVFLDDRDRHTYLNLLAKAAAEAKLHIWGYCLMPNHIHLIVVPERPDSMAATFRKVHGTYSRWLNIRFGRSGHVWQSRYFSCPLDAAHAAYAMRYVEFNPVRAGMVESVFDYQWSSARVHAGMEAPPQWLGAREWAAYYPPWKWREVLEIGLPESDDLERLREATRTGRPFGDPNFVRALEGQLGRPLTPRKPGPMPAVATQVRRVTAGSRVAEIGG